jgi:hypothetical protein
VIYTLERAKLVSEQLKRFTTGYTHHVAGQYVNIDFWLNEVLESLKTIDGYNRRFNILKEGQKEWVTAHDTKVFGYCFYCKGTCELSDGSPSLPIRTSSTEIKEARKDVINAAYYFLLRCYRIGLLSESEMDEKCNAIGTSIEPSDLKKKE